MYPPYYDPYYDYYHGDPYYNPSNQRGGGGKPRFSDSKGGNGRFDKSSKESKPHPTENGTHKVNGTAQPKVCRWFRYENRVTYRDSNVKNQSVMIYVFRSSILISYHKRRECYIKLH